MTLLLALLLLSLPPEMPEPVRCEPGQRECVRVYVPLVIEPDPPMRWWE